MSVHNSFTVGNNENHHNGGKSERNDWKFIYTILTPWQMDRQIWMVWEEQTKRWKKELMTIGIVNDVMDV